MHNQKIISVLGVALALSLSSQKLAAQAFAQYNFSSAAGGASVNFKLAPEAEAIEGSPFYNDVWQKATIYNRDNTYVELPQMKYNVNIDELVFLHDNGQYLVPNKESISRFTLGNDKFVGAFDGKRYSFFKVVEPGESLMLVRKFECRVKKGETSKGYIAATSDEYVQKESVYLLRPGHDAFEINPRKGDWILLYLKDKAAEVEAFIESEKLKMKSEDDLIKVVKYYNSLSAQPTNN